MRCVMRSNKFVHLRLGVGINVTEAFEPENVGESSDAHHVGRSEFRFGLVAQGTAITAKGTDPATVSAAYRTLSSIICSTLKRLKGVACVANVQPPPAPRRRRRLSGPSIA
jgi:hypothetical protein